MSGANSYIGQTSLDLAEQGINVLWGSFEIKNTRLMHKLLQQYMKDVLPVGLANNKDLPAEECFGAPLFLWFLDFLPPERLR